MDYLNILKELFIRFYYGSTQEPKYIEAREAKFIAKELITDRSAVDIVRATFPDLYVERQGSM